MTHPECGTQRRYFLIFFSDGKVLNMLDTFQFRLTLIHVDDSRSRELPLLLHCFYYVCCVGGEVQNSSDGEAVKRK